MKKGLTVFLTFPATSSELGPETTAKIHFRIRIEKTQLLMVVSGANSGGVAENVQKTGSPIFHFSGHSAIKRQAIYIFPDPY